jgi:hypothetical protein
MLDAISFGNRVEIGPGSVVLVDLVTDVMRAFPSIVAAFAWFVGKEGFEVIT